MFVYNKQKSQRDKELKSQSVESAMLKQVEIDTSKNESKNTESQIIIRVENRNANEKIEIHNENQCEIIQSEKLDEEYRAKLSELKLGF